MIYKAMFDTRTETWQAYGRAVFFDSEIADPKKLERLATAEALKDYPGAQIRVVSIGESTRTAWDGFLEKKRRLQEWNDRNKAGIPNQPSDLQPGQPSRGLFWFIPAKAAAIFAELERRPAILEDRREYCFDELRGAYSLTDEEAAALYLRILHVFKPEGGAK